MSRISSSWEFSRTFVRGFSRVSEAERARCGTRAPRRTEKRQRHPPREMTKNCENCSAAPAAWFCNSDGARSGEGLGSASFFTLGRENPNNLFPPLGVEPAPHAVPTLRRVPVHRVRHLHP